jgi:hypothetical protein
VRCQIVNDLVRDAEAALAPGAYCMKVNSSFVATWGLQWACEHHPKWVKEVLASGQMSPEGEERSRGLSPDA